ncbi:rRNA maturation RNase YbeY [Columbia Basin potato purple top phytoplasma]|uniref:Endoribonuclease YbeY n=1 Tax=Columbia Basin potato purple top phytoplasma TaxID=307134 RepID=A0ABT5L8H6_9MOLU|nr:rRNA maturation RNase YbeY [Columbia Basin potato purple top phytoplasma]MDC9031868.1 rRNA maturation RNase YbeY [Columbia Basin potato purple top phytoplasma]
MIVEIYNETKQKTINLNKLLIKIFSFIEDQNKINVIFISNNEMQKMNFYYRQKNYPTDVLTFPNDNYDNDLGDIFISLTKASEQAQKNKHSLDREVSFLALHGYLHLKGYNDDTEESLQEMIDIQENILKKHNI